MIRLTGTLHCTTSNEAALVASLLPDHIRLTRAEAECLSFDVTATADPLVFAVAECFSSRAGFDAHQSRLRDSAWFAVTADLRRAYQITED